MKSWKNLIEQRLIDQKNNIAKIDIDKVVVQYSEKIKQNRLLKSLTGDEEVVRAFLIDRLVNNLDYKPEYIEIEKEYFDAADKRFQDYKCKIKECAMNSF